MIEAFVDGTFQQMSVINVREHLCKNPQGVIRVPVISTKSIETINYDIEDCDNDIHENFFLRRFLYDSISTIDNRIPFSGAEFSYSETWRDGVKLECYIKSINPYQGLNSCMIVKTPNFTKSEGFLLNDMGIMLLLKIVEKVLC